jgi:hypothetical protein
VPGYSINAILRVWDFVKILDRGTESQTIALKERKRKVGRGSDIERERKRVRMGWNKEWNRVGKSGMGTHKE